MLRAENLKERERQAKGEIDRTKAKLLDCRSKLAYAKAQVELWRSKVMDKL